MTLSSLGIFIGFSDGMSPMQQQALGIFLITLTDIAVTSTLVQTRRLSKLDRRLRYCEEFVHSRVLEDALTRGVFDVPLLLEHFRKHAAEKRKAELRRSLRKKERKDSKRPGNPDIPPLRL